MYWSGKGTSEDYEKAFYWFSKAAEKGHAKAQNYLGAMYSSGRGVDENFEEAYIWLSIAAKQNHPNAQCRLALMYFNGNGVPKSLSCLLYTSPSPRDATLSRMPSSA